MQQLSPACINFLSASLNSFLLPLAPQLKSWDICRCFLLVWHCQRKKEWFSNLRLEKYCFQPKQQSNSKVLWDLIHSVYKTVVLWPRLIIAIVNNWLCPSAPFSILYPHSVSYFILKLYILRNRDHLHTIIKQHCRIMCELVGASPIQVTNTWNSNRELKVKYLSCASPEPG